MSGTSKKTLQKFYDFVDDDLKEREKMITTLTERGDTPIGSVGNEQAFGELVRETLKEYILRFKE